MKAAKLIYSRMPAESSGLAESRELFSHSLEPEAPEPMAVLPASQAVTVGVWDLDARVGRLDAVLDALNDSQEKVEFHEVHAPLPAGLVLSASQFPDWKRSRSLQVRRPSNFEDHLLSDVFYRQAKDVHRGTGMDILCGVTRCLIGGAEGGSAFWNHFTASRGKLLITSGYGLRRYAAQADRSYEAAIGFLVVAQTLVALSPRLGFHENDIGCMFDYNDDRDSIVLGLRKVEICPESLRQIHKDYREAAVAMADALRAYQPPAAESRKSAGPKAEIADLRRFVESLRSKMS